jgi:cellulose synthase/poly-beta-1,6-N-acetylglucosamine synthase-like glycosyltransferase
MEALFWISLGLLAYTYAGYFLLLNVIAPVVRRLRKPHRTDENHLPSVSMVLSLHNEENLIERRIENFEALDYPPEKIELLLGDDCSSDRTRAMIRERIAKNPRIRLVEFGTHQGKTAVINALVPQAHGEIVAFTDANTFWEPDSLRKMARHFADSRVGTVCGRLILQSRTGANIDDDYWRYETQIKQREGELGVVLGANGGIYALRKELFMPLKSDVIQIDDFLWPVKVYEKGFFGVYERSAIAREEAAPHVEAEFRRKIRIGTGDYRALVECRRLLAPWKGWISFAFWSHKVVRWAAPFLLIALFVSNILLLDVPIFRAFFIAQLAFYASAALGALMSRQNHIFAKIFRAPYYFVGSNLALLIGFWRCVTGRQKAAWSQKLHRAC